MSELAEELFNEGMNEGLSQGMAKGLSQGLEEGKLSVLIDLVKDGILTLEEASVRMGCTIQEFEAKKK